MSVLRWHRIDDGLTSSDGRYQIHRHYVDDSASHGVVQTFWILYVNGRPEASFDRQREAKAAAVKLASINS